MVQYENVTYQNILKFAILNFIFTDFFAKFFSDFKNCFNISQGPN